MLLLLLVIGACIRQPEHVVVETGPTTLLTLDQAAERLSELAGSATRNYSTYDFGRQHDTSARSVIVPRDKAGKLLEQLRKELGPNLVAFVGTTQWLGEEQPGGDELVIGVGASQLDMLRIARTDGINYGLETEDLVARLADYDGRYGIDIFHAETDTVEFVLGRMPEDLPGFCQELYEFCPDTVDQGSGSLAALEKEIRSRGQVFLWWD
jgi:hypothetical protein